MANSQEVYLGDSSDDRQSETAAETGNTCISETVKSTVKIPTTNLGYKTTYNCNEKVLFSAEYFLLFTQVVFQQSTFYLYFVTFFEYFFYFVTKYWNKVTNPALRDTRKPCVMRFLL